MAVNERNALMHAGRWPDYAQVWLGDTIYPSGRGQQDAPPGWQCPGCSRCYSPQVPMCHFCPAEPVNTGAPAPMGEWRDDA